MVGIDSESLVISPRLKITFVLDFRYSCSSHHPFAPGRRFFFALLAEPGTYRPLRGLAGVCDQLRGYAAVNISIVLSLTMGKLTYCSCMAPALLRLRFV